MIKREHRNAQGQQISEFAAAFALLFMFFFVPLFDLGVMPIRWILSQEIIQTYARQLSLCETFSQALAKLQADPSLETKLIRLGGVRPKNIRCRLIASTVRDSPPKHLFLDKPKNIPAEWLPNGRRAPIDYVVEVQADVELSPLFLVKLPEPKDANDDKKPVKVPGLNGPLPMTINAVANWENLGRDPVTKNFYINE